MNAEEVKDVGRGSGGRLFNELLGTTACTELRSKLVRCEIAPGTRLSEPALQEALGLGASPVRGAIRRLEFEDLLNVYPRGGTYATDIDLKGSRSVREVRLELEGMAASLAADRGTRAEKRDLMDLAERQQRADSLEECIDMDAEFHRSVYSMTRNSYLIKMAEIHFNLALRQWYFCSKVVETPEWVNVDHRSLAASIAQSRSDDARPLIVEHIRHSSQNVYQILTDYGL